MGTAARMTRVRTAAKNAPKNGLIALLLTFFNLTVGGIWADVSIQGGGISAK